MQYPKLFIFCLTFLFCSCQTKDQQSKKPLKENFNCKEGLMKTAWYEYGVDENIPSIKDLSSSFIILVDTSLKATNYISYVENYFRKQSKSNTDQMSYVGLFSLDDKKKISVKEKLKKLADQNIYFKQLADSTHIKNNNGQNKIWIINNTTDTVSIQMQDMSYICILQGLTKGGQWFPIQYWKFSTCGNSYYDKAFAPKTANSFIATIPKEGTYKTKLRFKFLCTDKFYYSNEFDGKIDYCDFVEDNTNFNHRGSKPEPHYKLDSVVHLSMY